MSRRIDSSPLSIMLLYLGRRGVMSRFTLEAMRAARGVPEIAASVCVSRQNESFSSFYEFGENLLLLDTFATNSGAFFAAWRIPFLWQRLATAIRKRHVETVIELMPHVWSPFLASAIRHTGADYITIAHDASAHPGDWTGLANGFLNTAMVQADRVITLSQVVRSRLEETGRVSPDRITSLFLPDVTYAPLATRRTRAPDAPLRLLFLGRIKPYKGIGIFLDALEYLHEIGVRVEAGVFGEGALGSNKARFTALGAEVVNRWLSEEEIATILPRFDVMVISHLEASQSAAIATAFGAGLPVVTTPVGGLPEQVKDGVTGLIAKAVCGKALAAEIKRLVLDPFLYSTICEGITAQSDSRSMRCFIKKCVGLSRCTSAHGARRPGA